MRRVLTPPPVMSQYSMNEAKTGAHPTFLHAAKTPVMWARGLVINPGILPEAAPPYTESGRRMERQVEAAPEAPRRAGDEMSARASDAVARLTPVSFMSTWP